MDSLRNSYTLEKARDGAFTLSIQSSGNKIYLHSAYSPSSDSRIFRGKFEPGKYDTLIILGTGLGYHLQELSSRAGDYRLIILVDAIAGIEEGIAGVSETAFLLEKDNIIRLFGFSPGDVEKKLGDLITLREMKGLQVLEHPQSLRAFPEYYEGIRAMVKKLVNRQSGDLTTRAALGMRFFKNSLTNLYHAGMHRPAKAVTDAFRGYRAVVVTAGPSLTENLDTLRHYQDNSFIIAVDSALSVLSVSGINPDFYVSLDPQPYVAEHFMRHEDRGTIPIVTMTSEPGIFRMKPGLLSLNSHPLSQLLEEVLPGEIGSFNSATGTVAGDAVRAAIGMGFDEIALAGFDFSFPRFETYAKGSAYQHRYACLFHNRFLPVETSNIRYIMKSSNALKAGGLFSRKSFLRYRESIEDMLEGNPREGLYHLSPPAIPLSGTAALTKEDFPGFFKSDPVSKGKIIRDCLEKTGRIEERLPSGMLSALLTDDLIERLLSASLEGDKNTIRRARRFSRRIIPAPGT